MTIAVEGPVDEAVLKRLLAEAGLSVAHVHGRQGKAHLDAQLRGFNQAARFAPWLVLRDLDHDAECAPALLRRLLPAPSARMRLRIAVRAAEAWLLADADALAAFLKVSPSRLPRRPDELDQPKQALVNLARTSRSQRIRDELVPAAGTHAKVGPLFGARLVEFAGGAWQPRRASRSSDSLRRCIRMLESWR